MNLNGTSSRRIDYVLRDHLGSPHTLLDDLGQITYRASFDPHGSRREGFDPTALIVGNNPLDDVTNRGFTGHEHLDSVAVIHMNGRIYDPILGRFLQADPLIQDLGNPQSLNRYTYVFNNPLAYTDPSGYGVLGKYGAQILNFATAWLSSGLYDAGYTNAALWVSVGGNAVSGWLASDSSTGALLGAFNGAAAFAVGSTTAGNGQSQISNRESKEGARSAPGGFRYWVSGSNFGSGIVPATLESGSSSQGTFVADSNLYNGVENVLKSMRKIPTFEELEKLALKRFPGFEWRVGRGGGSEFYPGTNERVFYPEKTDSSLKNPK